jgi:hypothetical protein
MRQENMTRQAGRFTEIIKPKMKPMMRAIIGLVCMTAFFHGANSPVLAQTNTSRWGVEEYGIIPMFTNNPAAMLVITNLLHGPMPALTVPAVSQSGSAPGTYWMLKGAPAPWPMNPYAELPAYQVTTNGSFIIDDRSVDYGTLAELNALEAEASGATNQVFTGCATCAYDEQGLLWIEVPTNSPATPDHFNVALHNTVQAQSYDILTTTDLAGTWATELVVTGAVGNVTLLEIPTSARTNLFVRARTSILYSFYLITTPLSQDVLGGDTVTFYVETGGNPNLTFQWTLNGNVIPGATNSSYTVSLAQGSDAGGYACIISDGTSTLVTAAAQLNVGPGTGDLNFMEVVSARQNYTFKSGVTYYLGSQIQFYGNTAIEAGAVIKPDWYSNAGLVIMGTLNCKGEPYYPAVITSVDDDSIGEGLGFSQQDGPPQPYQTGVPYLELACNKSNSISNLRIAYADWGVTTPTAARRLEVWDCQFLQCNYGIVNLVAGSSTNALHNVLFANCGAAFGAATNAITVEAEQMTADVTNFCLAYTTPARMDLQNSVIWGTAPDASSLSSLHVVLNPARTNFVTAGAGKYYLAADSSLHQSGSAGISSRLQSELKSKTTYAPLAISPFTQIKGQITLSPQAQRCTNGAPDIGYCYDALDYTVAGLVLNGGTLNVLPGTAVGLRMEYVPAIQDWTYDGFNLGNNSTITGQGMPDKPCVFVDVQQVQEQFEWPVMVGFVPNYLPANDGDQPPVMNFRFANFYAGYVSYYALPQYHFWSGISLYGYEWSLDSAMTFTLQDCQVRGGQIDIGTPDNPDTGQGILNYDTILGSGAVAWNNNLFDGVSINLNPTYYWMIATNNCDLQVTAHNNLFRNSAWLVISGTPATAGNWTFRDNLFDKVRFFQDPTLPLDFDHNGYWPLTDAEIVFGASGYTNLLQATATSSGATELFLSHAPPYQGGAFGNYYLSATTPLYQAGSRTATDAGLAQYTTFVNQTKDAASQPVNVGLHYVTATNSLPFDSDGDGVPDFVEAEHGTDLNNAMTDGVTNDTYNAAYDDVDLSGNGLVGRIKKALGLDPLSTGNPLTLNQVALDEEWGIITYELPISYSILTNIGGLNLTMNGVDVTLEDIGPGTNGNTLLNWNSLYDPPGQHYVQARITVTEAADDQSITAAFGKIAPCYSDNVVRFFESDAMFDNGGAFLDAQLPVQNADYVIRIYDSATAPPIILKSLTNSTSNGMIQEDWDLSMDGNSNTFAGTSFTASFDVTLLDSSGGAPIAQKQQSKAHNKIVTTEHIDGLDGFNIAYFYTPTNSEMASLFYHGDVWYGMQGVVDILTMPSWPWDVYNSSFNLFGYPTIFVGYPGYVTSMSNSVHSVWGGLYPSMGDGLTKNFYGYGHGNNGYLGTKKGEVSVTASAVADILGNHYSSNSWPGGLNVTNPYRFAFMDGCSTASGNAWRRAFGIMPIWAAAQAARSRLGPQAYVGYAQEKGDRMGGGSTNATINALKATAYTETLQYFFLDWMNGVSLAQCIRDASNTNLVECPFTVPEVKLFTINGAMFTNNLPSKIYVVGHSGLTVTGLISQDDNQFVGPKNIQ